jgi:V8-like Glu-specific endopeptidase
MNSDRFFPLSSMVTAFVLLVVGATLVLAASAPMRVVSEGLTAEEQVAAQAELSGRLLKDMPSNAIAVQILFTTEEAAAVDAKKSTVPLKIGVVKPITPQIKVHGITGLVWAAIFSSGNAGAIRLHIKDMSLPAGAELFIYSRDGQAYGPYTGAGPNGTGEFWTATIFGTEAILQLQAKSDLNDGSLRIVQAGLITPRYAGGTKDFSEDVNAPNANWPCGNPICIIDATCTNVQEAEPAKLAVAKMEWPQGAYIYTCTGGLINDNNPSQNNFFLTANHCVSKNSNAKNVNFYWRFATATCNAPCPSNDGWPFQSSGSTVAATGRKGDFTLLHLNSNPPAGSTYLGWNSAPVANTNDAHLYRISNPNFGPQVYSQHDVDTSAPVCRSWPRGERIYSRDITGAIDGGSSGSPVLNASSQIVGQLSGTCGTNPSDPCASGEGEDNATVDGAFAFYYSTVQPILNP